MEFFKKYKKLFIAAGFIVLVLILGYSLYALFLKPATPATPTSEEPEGEPFVSGGLPTAEKGTKRTTAPAAESGKFPFMGERTGAKANETAAGGLTKVKRLSDSAALGASPDPSGRGVRYYNENDGKFYRIGRNGKIVPLSDKTFHSVRKIVWSPNADKAILEYPDGANIVYDFAADKQITLPKHWKDFDFSANK